ncbi:MAG: serine hydrolase [Bacteroidota bacterium]
MIRASLLFAFLFTGCAGSSPDALRLATTKALVPARPATVGMHSGLSRTLDALIESALADSAASGAVVAVGRHGRLVHHHAYGTVAYAHLVADPARVTPSTRFDLASLTKVVATTTAAMLLEEEGQLYLDARIADLLPGFDDPAKAAITVRMLLEHRGGLEPFARLYEDLRGRDAYLAAINSRPLRHEPGTVTLYSDWDLILLQLVIERIANQSLDAFVQARIFAPLGMTRTGFRPAVSGVPRRAIIATEVDAQGRTGLIHGEVHDPNAWALGGVAGHAGLFSTAHDLAVFAQLMLNGGTYNGIRLLRPATVARWTAVQDAASSRALGWDTPSGVSSSGRYFGPRAFGHTGYTGTSLWIDPDRGLFVVLLTNRVHPTSANRKHIALRRALADAVQAAILDAPRIDWEARRSGL